MAEVFRGGIEAVHPGQVEAAKSLGMGPALTLWRVVLPHAFKVALPLYGNTCIMLIKDTLRASIITVTELSFQSKVIAATRPGPHRRARHTAGLLSSPHHERTQDFLRRVTHPM